MTTKYQFGPELNDKLVQLRSKVDGGQYQGIYSDTSAFTFKLTCAIGDICGTKELWIIESVEEYEKIPGGEALKYEPDIEVKILKEREPYTGMNLEVDFKNKTIKEKPEDDLPEEFEKLYEKYCEELLKEKKFYEKLCNDCVYYAYYYEGHLEHNRDFCELKGKDHPSKIIDLDYATECEHYWSREIKRK